MPNTSLYMGFLVLAIMYLAYFCSANFVKAIRERRFWFKNTPEHHLYTMIAVFNITLAIILCIIILIIIAIVLPCPIEPTPHQ